MHCTRLASIPGSIMRKFSILILLSLAACSRDAELPARTLTTIVISGPEEEVKKPIDVRSFAVHPESLRQGQPAAAKIELEVPRPSQQLSVDWYGPGGWLVAYEIRDAAAASLGIPAPVGRFDEPGRYRAVLRSGRTMLAEDAVVVRPGA